ncbi:AAA family ATPase [Vibrio splendidus]
MKIEQLDLFGDIGMQKKTSNLVRYFGNLAFTVGSSGFDQLTSWLVKDFIPALSFGVVFGASGTLKTFLAIDLCCCVTTGRPWLGKRVKQGAVVYVAAEGQLGVSKRVKAWEIANGESVKHLYILPQSMFMSESQNQKELIEAIQDIEHTENVKVQLVVIDTLARCFVGDENTSKDMNKFIQGCDRVKQETQASVMCIHHSGRDESKGARGSTALRAASDFEFQAKRNGKAKLLRFINTKQKEGQEAPDLEMEFDSVDLGVKCDENNPITSLARLKDASAKGTEKDEADCPVLKLLSEKFGGKAKRIELRQALYPSDAKPSDAQRKYLSRSILKLKASDRIAIEQKSSIRASDEDVITITH